MMSRRLVYTMAGALALLSVLSFLTVLPPLGEFCLQAIAIVFLCMLLYYAHVADVLLGVDSRQATMTLIASCLVLSVRPVVEALRAPLGEGFLSTLLMTIGTNIDDAFIFALGTVLFLILAISFTLRYKPRSPSVMAMLGEKGRLKHLDHFAVRAILTFFVIVAFYILVFDIILQWAGIIASSATIVVLLAWLVDSIVRPGTSIATAKKFVMSIENIDEKLFGSVVTLFHDRTTVLFGIAALLVFYPLSDLGSFIVPYVTNIPNTFIASLDALTHTPLSILSYEAFMAKGVAQGVFVSLASVLNAVAAIMVLFLPALYWYRMFRKRTLALSPLASALLVAGAVCFLLTPAFTLGRLGDTTDMVGVDIGTRSLAADPVMWSVIAAVVAGAIVLVLAHRFTVATSLASIGLTLVFLARYMALYFTDVWAELLDGALAFLHTPSVGGYLAGFLFLSFLTISIIFYIGAIAVYFYEIWVTLWHEHHQKKRTWLH